MLVLNLGYQNCIKREGDVSLCYYVRSILHNNALLFQVLWGERYLFVHHHNCTCLGAFFWRPIWLYITPLRLCTMGNRFGGLLGQTLLCIQHARKIWLVRFNNSGDVLPQQPLHLPASLPRHIWEKNMQSFPGGLCAFEFKVACFEASNQSLCDDVGVYFPLSRLTADSSVFCT